MKNNILPFRERGHPLTPREIRTAHQLAREARAQRWADAYYKHRWLVALVATGALIGLMLGLSIKGSP